MSKTERPGPLTCGQCRTVTDAWVFDPARIAEDLRHGDSVEQAGWWFDDEWWVDPKYFWELDSYCCSRTCYLARADSAKVKA